MNIAEQIRAWLEHRKKLVDEMSAIQQKAADDGEDGRSLSEEEGRTYDGLEAEVTSVDEQVKRLQRLKALQDAAADGAEPAGDENLQPVPDAGGDKAKAKAQQRRRSAHIVVNRNKDDAFEGQSYVRKLIARTIAKLDENFASPVAVAQARGWHRTNPQLVEVIKADVAGHGSGSGEAGAELLAVDETFTGDFIEYLHGKTVYFQLDLREVPANVTIHGQDGAMTGYWVGQSKGIPVTKGDFSEVTLSPLKVAAISVSSMELLRDSSPSAELLLRDSLVEAAAKRIDDTFISVLAASANVSPAGILNGVTALGASGIDAPAVRRDIGELLTPFIQNRNGGGQVLIMNPLLAVQMALMVNNNSSMREFAGLTMGGGEIVGIPAVTGDNVPDDWLVMVKPSDIYRIGQSGIQISASRDASLAMSDAPTMDTDTPTEESVVSMFQTESVAFKIVQPINFQKRRTHAAQYMSDAQYGETETVTA